MCSPATARWPCSTPGALLFPDLVPSGAQTPGKKNEALTQTAHGSAPEHMQDAPAVKATDGSLVVAGPRPGRAR